MELTQEQINIISSNILLEDIKAYINATRDEFEQFLKDEKI